MHLLLHHAAKSSQGQSRRFTNSQSKLKFGSVSWTTMEPNSSTVPPPLVQIVNPTFGAHTSAGIFVVGLGSWWAYFALRRYFQAKASGKQYVSIPLTYWREDSKYPIELYIYGLILPTMIQSELLLRWQYLRTSFIFYLTFLLHTRNSFVHFVASELLYLVGYTRFLF